MNREGSGLRLSASDPMRFMSCAHASLLDLARLHGRGPEPAEDSADAERLQKRVDAHGGRVEVPEPAPPFGGVSVSVK